MRNLNNNEKLIVIVPDGMTDLPGKAYRTPLQVCQTPNMDFMLKNGITGVVQTVPPAIEPGSDVANLSILGVDPLKTRIGRGALEALSQNIQLKKDEYVFRANFVYIKNNIMKDYAGDGIKTGDAKKVIAYLNKNIDSNVRFITGVDYRNLAIIKTNKKINITTTAPHNILDKRIDKYLPNGKNSSIVIDIMEKTKELILKSGYNKNAANMLWLWGQGKINKKVMSFKKRYGLSGAVISAVDIIRGIGRLLKMDIIRVPGITGDFNTNYKNKALFALKNLKKYDFIYIHIEAPDEAGHQGNFNEKVKAIEKIDKLIIGTLLKSKERLNILVLPDHPTPIRKRTHINEPVPFIFYSKNKNISNHNFSKFDESINRNAPVRIDKGYRLLDWILKKIYN